MGLAPPPVAEQAILGATSKITRRCDIFESDGVTPWTAGGTLSRLMDGGVNIDYTRDERRSLDLTLDNSDGALRHDPAGFWYDKVLKIYHGVEYVDTTPVPTVFTRINQASNPSATTNLTYYLAYPGASGTAALSNPATGGADNGPFARMTWSVGCTLVGAANAGLQYGFDQGVDPNMLCNPGEYISASVKVRTSKAQRMTLHIQYISVGGTTLGIARAHTLAAFVTTPNTWQTVEYPTSSAAPAGTAKVRLYLFSTGGTGLVTWDIGDTLDIDQIFTIRGQKPLSTSAYFDGSFINTSNVTFSWTGTANASTSIQAIAGSVASVVTKTWEAQIGEFMIDRLEEQNFPPSVKVTGRDYTKKCLISKFTTATAFAMGSTIESVIRAVATNAGVTKFLLPVTGKTTGKDFFFERGVERWAAMKEIANAYGYDLFFDAQGYLVMELYQDPVFAATAYALLTGPVVGNLVSFTKSTNDSRLYNHVVVTGESSDTSVLPVSAEATNTEPSSPSRIARIGDRVYQFTSAFITTVLQAQAVADNFLRVHALEEYDINFSSITLPWLEVGEIVEFFDPKAGPTDPTRFLLSSLSIPLGLSPMSGNAKRVGIVG